MFNRQWFPPGSQYGLSHESKYYNKLLLEHKYGQVPSFISNVFSQNPEFWTRQYLRYRNILKKQTIKKRQIAIFWDCFWPDFNIHDNQLLDLFRHNRTDYFNIISTSDPLEADISIYSCYGQYSSLDKTKHTTRILFLGENVRPSYLQFDYSLTSDLCSYSDLNCYLPLWFLEIDFFQKEYLDRKPVPLPSFTLPRPLDLSQRKKGVVYIGNNNEPFRMSIISHLRAIGVNVDCYGSQTKPIESKIDLYNQYKYILSPENSFSEGYVTEKLMNSYSSGSYFLYWGGWSRIGMNEPRNMIPISPYTDSMPSLFNILNDSYPDKFNLNPLFSQEFIASRLLSLEVFVGKILGQHGFDSF